MKVNISMLESICFFERYYLNAQEITGGSISIPERYSVYDIENFSSIYGKGYLYGGYDV